MGATPTKKKLCWNCDGNVPLKAEHCPYCGVYIEQTTEVEEDEDDLEQDGAHAPPYTLSGGRATNGEIPASPYAAPKKPKPAAPAPKAPKSKVQESVAPAPTIQSVIIPLLLLISGSVFALFGLVLFLFSDNGLFILKWNGDHWPAYLVVGSLLLLGGWRLVGKLDDATG